MTAAILRRRAHNGPDAAKAAAALLIAGICLGLLIFLLTPLPGVAVKGAAATDQLHWRHPASDGAAKFIPI